MCFFFFFQAEDGIRDKLVTGVQTCALPICSALVRAVAVRGVSRALVDSARLDPQAVVERLRPLFTDRDPRVRINALRALATFRDSARSRLAASLAGDADVNVAAQAATTLGAPGGRAAVEALTARLEIGRAHV